MKIGFIKPIQFGYRHFLKDYYKQGKLHTVTRGLYGGELSFDTVTLEHLVPHSKKGRTVLSNLALAVDENNWKRGNKPLRDFLTKEMFDEYCEQFRGIRLPFFNGDEYIKMITKTVKKALQNG